ncbi:hypothetical protein CN692_14230 [Bacillus sp. AFS002410]|uniref:hypothetical protein n=1 Tax=Bacillus sp. AFS002410 TaxID=2033481 RepID=UPI000BEF56A8|nr:hypothetical protein [Bacillus sp. AFS002410]PEJ57052.1 hypothetical protein CN692_14230 [Bacillus sp. AFS002410]
MKSFNKLLISAILITSLAGCSTDTTTTTTAEKHIPTAKVEKLGVSVFTNDTTYTKNEKIIVTLVNNAKTIGTFKVNCEPNKESMVYSDLLDDEADELAYILKPGQKQKIVFKRTRSFQKGEYHVTVRTAPNGDSSLNLDTLASEAINLK